ncbi:MAG: 4-(cytidine 5'-diphospho)-2-C-methyl-D-erythritol kinase, partial [Negativicoccus succinicivorans]|nr:4-(cytidine 5'-diphospho)-2-C-methyl-D-erythritol kinase [Negativicoccus succinicivorans]
MQEELAPAKINLALAITGRRVDGYHNIDTVMHSITLSDSVFFSPADELIFRCNDLSLPLGAGNLAWEAAQ